MGKNILTRTNTFNSFIHSTLIALGYFRTEILYSVSSSLIHSLIFFFAKTLQFWVHWTKIYVIRNVDMETIFVLLYFYYLFALFGVIFFSVPRENNFEPSYGYSAANYFYINAFWAYFDSNRVRQFYTAQSKKIDAKWDMK